MAADVGNFKGSRLDLTVPGAVGHFQIKASIWGKRWSYLLHPALTLM